MCLDTLCGARELERVRRLGPIIAWKVVCYSPKVGPNFISKYQYMEYAPSFVSKKDESSEMLIISRRRHYRTGFHAYATREGAQNVHSEAPPIAWYPGSKIVPVLLKRIVAVGKQDGQRVYVAREMTILADVPELPKPPAPQPATAPLVTT